MTPINRAELAMTGREESSCKSALDTVRRMLGMTSPTAIASAESEKIRSYVVARIARRGRENRWGNFAWSSDNSAISAVSTHCLTHHLAQGFAQLAMVRIC